MNEWISVEDRLPEKGEHVFCYCREDYEQRGYHVKTTHWDGEGDTHEFKSVYERYISVTHWMPLPKPPEEQE